MVHPPPPHNTRKRSTVKPVKQVGCFIRQTGPRHIIFVNKWRYLYVSSTHGLCILWAGALLTYRYLFLFADPGVAEQIALVTHKDGGHSSAPQPAAAGQPTGRTPATWPDSSKIILGQAKYRLLSKSP
jgi:hypothetical protein